MPRAGANATPIKREKVAEFERTAWDEICTSATSVIVISSSVVQERRCRAEKLRKPTADVDAGGRQCQGRRRDESRDDRIGGSADGAQPLGRIAII